MLYLDSYVLMNFLMDVLLLWGTGGICGQRPKWRKLCGAGAIGALYSVIGLFVRLPGLLHIMVELAGMSLLMCRVAFPFSTKKKWVVESVTFCLLAFVTGGMLDAFYYASGAGFVMRQGEEVPAALGILALSAGIVAFLVSSIREKKQRIQEEKPYAEVEIVFPEGTISVTGLFDTGNRLRVQGKPVGVLEEAVVMPGMDLSKCFPVFYQSVGRKEGVMPARIAEKIRVRNQDGEFVAEQPLIAFSREKLSSDGSYQMLLPVDWRDV